MVSRPARDPDGAPMPSYAQVFATRGYLPLFLAASLSTWGDFLARVTVAAFVFQQTRSPLAAAATFAVSLLPTLFGRSLLAPLADRIPYKYVLIASHLARAVLVGALIVAVGSGVSLACSALVGVDRRVFWRLAPTAAGVQHWPWRRVSARCLP